jgi:hypothetical protein
MDSRKQVLMILAMVAVLGLLAVQPADARGWGRSGAEYACNSYEEGLHRDEKIIAAREKFHRENVELRRDMVTKKAELHALMQQENPDATRAAKLRGEIFDLRETLHQKAVAAGLPEPGFRKAGRNGPECRGAFGGKHRRYGRGSSPKALWN